MDSLHPLINSSALLHLKPRRLFFSALPLPLFLFLSHFLSIAGLSTALLSCSFSLNISFSISTSLSLLTMSHDHRTAKLWTFSLVCFTLCCNTHIPWCTSEPWPPSPSLPHLRHMRMWCLPASKGMRILCKLCRTMSTRWVSPIMQFSLALLYVICSSAVILVLH